MKKYRTIFTAFANLDVNSISDYIGTELGNYYAALRFVDEVEKKAASLKTMPKRHPPVRDAYRIRAVPMGNYAAFYVILEEAGEVWILRVLHKKRNWAAILKDGAGTVWLNEDDETSSGF
ncbi:MAG: type II toxin-antitoxin system RelE/ParE family toxin [Clostridiales Family XIII bacterium]|jgi:plasmid stabilization system protein ParE|nr:type II toxin-antitoxin system RelE/ParE family toxin [Clostridiales Family XIII bacterium]